MQLPHLFKDAIGLVAGSHDGISTGFDFTVLKRLHVGATAWNVFAQLGWNPYWQKRSIGPDGDGDGDVDLDDFSGFARCVTGPHDGESAETCDVFDADRDAVARVKSGPGTTS